jgi:hypothetical protein
VTTPLFARLAALVMLATPVSARAADFVVEDPALTDAPAVVVAAITSAAAEPLVDDDGTACRFLSRAVDLDGDGRATDWVATTADACAWAASAAPVWVVYNGGGRARVVLDFVTYDLTLGRPRSHGLRNIATARGTAAMVEEELWRYDGTRYRRIRTVKKAPG